MGTKRGFHQAYWLLPVFAAAGVALLALLVTTTGVRVVDTSPGDGRQDAPMTAPIRITFSQPMDAASVGAHLRIEPEVDGTLAWEGREAIFRPRSALAPGMAYTVTLEAGALSQQGRPLRQARTWRFRTRDPHLLYLARARPGAENRQLSVAAADGVPARQLTDAPWGVWDYAVHPQGEGIVYSALREDGGSDLWRMERDGGQPHLLLACPEAACLNPAWSPDGRQLAYERRDIWAGAPNLDPKAGRIWLLDLEEGKERRLFDYDVPLHSPVWSPRGERLAYASPLIPGVEVYDLRSGDLQPFGNEWGAAPVWSPDGAYLVLPELMAAGEAFVVRLVRIDLAGEQLLDISGEDDFVQDASPAWSPGGGWIVFGRQFLDDERWTPGRQPWLTRPDGTEAYPLPVEDMADHFAFAWRPDGAALAYARTDLSEGPQAVPDVSIWVYDLARRERILVSGEGVLPKWLP